VTIENTMSADSATARGRVLPRQAAIDQPLRFRLGPIVTRDGMALRHEPIRHPASHDTEADVSEVCHNAGRVRAS
jgi:hypothetical protein